MKGRKIWRSAESEIKQRKGREKDGAGYKDNDSKIGKTGSTTGNNEKTNTQNEEQDVKQIETGKDEERKNIEKEQERNNKERQNLESETCQRCKEYVETGEYCEKCHSWYHYECEDTTKKQIMKMYTGQTHYICKKDQKIEYEKTWIINYKRRWNKWKKRRKIRKISNRTESSELKIRKKSSDNDWTETSNRGTREKQCKRSYQQQKWKYWSAKDSCNW